MKQGDTEYYLATSPQDYRKANEFVRKQGLEGHKLRFPTIIAKRYLNIVGLLSTQPRDDMILAGPLLINVSGNGSFVAMRLVQVYDDIMRKAGVALYNFEATGKFITACREMAEDMGLEEVKTLDSGSVWFKRRL